MKLFAFLQTHVPRPVAIVVTALWFGLLLSLGVFFADEPQAVFRYGNL